MAESSSQPEGVPQGDQLAEAAEAPIDSKANDVPQSTAGVHDDDAPAESLVDGNSISEEDINTLLNAAEGVLPTSADESPFSFGGESDDFSPRPESEEGPPDTRPFDLPEFAADLEATIDPKRVTMLNDVNLRVRLQLGQTRMYLEDVLKLSEGSVVELDKLAGDPVDVLVNDRLVARGEVLVLNDVFCVRICEVLSNDPHRITV